MTQEELAKAHRVYISGAISGKPIEEARAEFKQAEDYIRSLGLEPVNPFDNGLTEEHTWLEHMHRDIDLVASCGAIYMLEGWCYSNGASIEREVAEKLELRYLEERETFRDRPNVYSLKVYAEELERREARSKE